MKYFVLSILFLFCILSCSKNDNSPPLSRKASHLNPEWKPDSSINEHYNDQTGEWEYNSKAKFEWDVNGWRLKNIYYSWSERDEVWRKGDKEEYAYYSNYREMILTRYLWMKDIGKYMIGWKFEGPLDENGYEIERIAYTPRSYLEYTNSAFPYESEEDWFLSSKTEYIYDSYGNRIESNHYRWENEQWIQAHKFECIYDNYGNATKTKSMYWENNQWELLFQSRYGLTYEEGELKERTSEKWKRSTGEWQTTRKSKYFYYNNGSRKHTISYAWNGEWTLSGRTTIYY